MKPSLPAEPAGNPCPRIFGLSKNAFWLICIWQICFMASSVESAEILSTRPVVMVSIEPIALLVREICGDDCDVLTLIPRGVSEHSWQPGPRDMAKAQKAVASIAVGLNLDNSWFKKMGAVPKSVLWLGESLSPMPWWSDDMMKGAGQSGPKASVPAEHSEHSEHSEHDHGALDPHVWLDAERMSRASELVANHLSVVIPASSKAITSRGHSLSARLLKLQGEIQARRMSWRSRPVVMFHDVAGYFGRRYNLPILSLAAGSSGHDISARMIADISKRFNAASVAAVMVERDDGAAKNLARELHTSIKVIDFAAAKSYAKWDDWFLKIVDSWEDVLKK